MVMQTEKPKLNSVYVKVQEFRDGRYYASTSLTLYDTTATRVMKLIQDAVKENGNGK